MPSTTFDQIHQIHSSLSHLFVVVFVFQTEFRRQLKDCRDWRQPRRFSHRPSDRPIPRHFQMCCVAQSRHQHSHVIFILPFSFSHCLLLVLSLSCDLILLWPWNKGCLERQISPIGVWWRLADHRVVLLVLKDCGWPLARMELIWISQRSAFCRCIVFLHSTTSPRSRPRLW